MKRYVFNKYALPNYLFIMVLLAMAFSIIVVKTKAETPGDAWWVTILYGLGYLCAGWGLAAGTIFIKKETNDGNR